ncbi:hypothetical protein ACAG25_04315 [Mycobacterium sp. pV006]|uniref:hypothetical protein n=1 Tax=Mycobacterium sp. pV006 TaxID=3238983 RepID=UPI00351BB660
MSIKDDVKEDLAAAYPRLGRSDLERVVTLLAQAPATGNGTSTATALEPLMPEVARRLGPLSGTDVPDYLRVLQGAVTTTLQSWKDPSGPGPGIGEIHSFIDTAAD